MITIADVRRSGKAWAVDVREGNSWVFYHKCSSQNKAKRFIAEKGWELWSGSFLALREGKGGVC
jgi:hypothetical protein